MSTAGFYDPEACGETDVPGLQPYSLNAMLDADALLWERKGRAGLEGRLGPANRRRAHSRQKERERHERPRAQGLPDTPLGQLPQTTESSGKRWSLTGVANTFHFAK